MDKRILTHPAMLIIVLPALDGCAAETGGAGAEPTVRDSAGVTIVENTAPRNAGDAAWHVATIPRVTIGGGSASPGAELYRVTSGMRLDDGRIVVANSGTGEIRFYNEMGGLVESVGRQGGGPGEFQSLTAVRRYGSDSIVALDNRQRRMTFYDLHGNLSRVTTITPGEGANVPFLQGVMGIFGDGTFFLASFDPFSTPPQSGPSRAVEQAFRLSANGTFLDSLGSFGGLEIYIEASGGGFRTTPRIFGYSTLYAVVEGGFFAGSNEQFEISRYTPTGELEMSIRTNHQLVPVGEHHRDLFMQERTADMSTADRLAYEKRFEISKPPPTFPAYDDLIADREGSLWVSSYLPPDETDQHFSVFDTDGVWITDVDVPDHISVLEIGSDYVLALWTDDLDIEHVGEFVLTKPDDSR